jgi:hypothetical protein
MDEIIFPKIYLYGFQRDIYIRRFLCFYRLQLIYQEILKIVGNVFENIQRSVIHRNEGRNFRNFFLFNLDNRFDSKKPNQLMSLHEVRKETFSRVLSHDKHRF